MWESVSSTRPVTEPLARGRPKRQKAVRAMTEPRMRGTRLLKKIGHPQIIMIVQPRAAPHVRRSQLHALQAKQHVGSKAIHQIRGIALIFVNHCLGNLRRLIALLTRDQMKRQLRSGQPRQLRPPAHRLYRFDHSRPQNKITWPDCSQARNIFAVIKCARKLYFLPWIRKPIETEQARWNRSSVFGCLRGMEPRREFDAGVFSELVPEFEAAFYRRPGA